MTTFQYSLVFLVLMAVIVAGDVANVTYDGRSLIIDGEHKILFSGSIHYTRSTPQVILSPFSPIRLYLEVS